MRLILDHPNPTIDTPRQSRLTSSIDAPDPLFDLSNHVILARAQELLRLSSSMVTSQRNGAAQIMESCVSVIECLIGWPGPRATSQVYRSSPILVKARHRAKWIPVLCRAVSELKEFQLLRPTDSNQGAGWKGWSPRPWHYSEYCGFPLGATGVLNEFGWTQHGRSTIGERCSEVYEITCLLGVVLGRLDLYNDDNSLKRQLVLRLDGAAEKFLNSIVTAKVVEKREVRAPENSHAPALTIKWGEVTDMPGLPGGVLELKSRAEFLGFIDEHPESYVVLRIVEKKPTETHCLDEAEPQKGEQLLCLAFPNADKASPIALWREEWILYDDDSCRRWHRAEVTDTLRDWCPPLALECVGEGNAAEREYSYIPLPGSVQIMEALDKRGYVCTPESGTYRPRHYALDILMIQSRG